MNSTGKWQLLQAGKKQFKIYWSPFYIEGSLP